MTALLGRPGTRTLAAHIDRRGAHRRNALRERIATVVEVLSGAPATGDLATTELLLRLEQALRDPSLSQLWLALAVISGRLPDDPAVQQALRTARLDGSLAALRGTIAAIRPPWPIERGPWRRVRVVTDEVLVDLQHTARTGLATGIQRVARESARRWSRDHEPLLVGWTADMRGLRALDAAEREQALYGGAVERLPRASRGEVIVPWRCTYVLPELMTEAQRARPLQAMLRYSGSQGAMIGFDCVPLTSAETIADGMGAGFSIMLSAMAHGDRIATISESAGTEYRGWRTMLSGAGLTGPDIEPIVLPVDAVEPSAAAIQEARDLLITGGLPVVLCVGSHEPRKNHLAVLHAAELLWREGLAFSLVFVGGNAWNGQRFEDRLAELKRMGRPVESVRALSDDLLWAAYRLARCVVFPSLNEGFGLPVAESLASGTPVITSAFGSMREIAAHGGAILIDPRDDHDLRRGLHTLLTDDDVHARLSAEARHRTVRSWDDYAAETWSYLVDGRLPERLVSSRPAGAA